MLCVPATNPREISSRKVQSMKQDELKFRSQNVSASEDVFPGGPDKISVWHVPFITLRYINFMNTANDAL